MGYISINSCVIDRMNIKIFRFADLCCGHWKLVKSLPHPWWEGMCPTPGGERVYCFHTNPSQHTQVVGGWEGRTRHFAESAISFSVEFVWEFLTCWKDLWPSLKRLTILE